MAGALAVTLLTAGSLEDLIGLGAETIRELESRPDSGAELEAELERAYAEGVESNG